MPECILSPVVYRTGGQLMLPRPLMSSSEGFVSKAAGSTQREYVAHVPVIVPCFLQAEGINIEGWPIVRVRIEVRPPIKLDWVFGDESPGRLIVVSGAIIRCLWNSPYRFLWPVDSP